MKKLTKEQEQTRDAEVDWLIAKTLRHAQHQVIWKDFSPTTDWNDAGPLIETYQIDIRFFSKESNSALEFEWMGGLLVKNKKGIVQYVTAFGPTPLHAAMKALSLSI